MVVAVEGVRRACAVGLLLLAALSAASCISGGDDKSVAGVVLASDAPFGPRIVFDPLARPVPVVPFPNDLLLRPEPDSPSGAAWNISTGAFSNGERRIRRMLGELDGFGLYAPITVSFSGPLDLTSVTDDSIYVVNVERGTDRYGERVALDLGRGHFPETWPPTTWWAWDDLADQPGLMFDSDNVADADGDGDVERVTHWEVATNTLILRPIRPLAPGARHAVVITRGVEGWVHDADHADGEQPVRAPVRSPFLYKAHAAQAEFVAEALDVLALDTADLAFGWTFTTAQPALPLLALRDGLRGEGPMARLAGEFPPRFGEIRDTGVDVDNDLDLDGEPDDFDGDGEPDDPRDHRYILQAEYFGNLFGLVEGVQEGLDLLNFQSIDYFVFGSFETPDLRTGEAGTMGVNPLTGAGEVGRADVPFVLSVPKTVPGKHEPPFQVLLYFHGTATSRMESLAIADVMARQGIATLSFDQVGHGPIIPDVELAVTSSGFDLGLIELLGPLLGGFLVPDRAEEFEGLEWFEVLEKLDEIGVWRELSKVGRTEDANGDGALESSESFFFADPFRQCASFWQDLSDLFYVVNVLRSLDQAAVGAALADPAAADPELLSARMAAGDFNGDGVLDIGGPDVLLSTAGTSLGGFHAIMAAALEPEITVASPIVGGGGLLDIMTNTDFHDVSGRIFLEVFGPLVVGCPDGDGGVWLSFNDDSDHCDPEKLATKSFAHIEQLPRGSLITLTNVDNGASVSRFHDADGFSIAVDSDRWDQLEVAFRHADGTRVVVPVVTPYEGLAFRRNSPPLRRFIHIGSHVLDRCDPMSFARHLFLEPLPGHPPVDILFEQAVGDDTVPIATGVQVALAAGVFGDDEATWRAAVQPLLDHGIFAGNMEFDPDDVRGDNPPDQPGLGPTAAVQSSPDGLSSIRFADVDGDHEWIATVDQSQEFDRAMYSQQQIALFHWSQGALIIDDVCINQTSCDLLDDPGLLLQP